MRLSRIACLLAAVIASAAVTGASAQSALPDGKIGIHYSRCDGSYDGWGLHLWRNPNIPIDGVEWSKPLMPTGKDDFGVLWQVDASQFGNAGTVNYILHKGDTKEQGGSDMKFDGKTTKQIWINGGDRKIHTSIDDAKKARAEKPCS